MPRIAAGYRQEQGDADLRRVDQSRPRTYADLDSAPIVCVPSGAVSEGQELPPTIDGVSEPEEKILGPTSLGERLLGGIKRQRDR